MTSTNTYSDTRAVDYLEALKRNQIDAYNSRRQSDFTLTYMLPVVSSTTVSNSFTNTQKTLGDYEVIDSSSKLVCHLPLNYDVRDASNSNHGTITGTETYVAGPEISSTHSLRKALSFNGTTNYVTLSNPSNFSFDKTDPFSISLWYLNDSTGITYPSIFSKSNEPTTTVGYALTIDRDNQALFFNIHDGTTNYQVLTDNNTIINNLWNHIVCTKGSTANQNAMKIYVNGSLSKTGTSSTINNSITNALNPVIGAQSDTDAKFKGYVDSFQVWNVELSSSDVTELYSGKIPNKTAVTKPAILSFSDVT